MSMDTQTRDRLLNAEKVAARSLTNEQLAYRLFRLAENPRSFDSLKRDAAIFEAGMRLRDGLSTR